MLVSELILETQLPFFFPLPGLGEDGPLVPALGLRVLTGSFPLSRFTLPFSLGAYVHGLRTPSVTTGRFLPQIPRLLSPRRLAARLSSFSRALRVSLPPSTGRAAAPFSPLRIREACRAKCGWCLASVPFFRSCRSLRFLAFCWFQS